MFPKTLQNYQNAYETFRRTRENIDGIRFLDLWVNVIADGRKFTKEIFYQKHIPLKLRKTFEIVMRTLVSARRMPKDLVKWNAKYLPMFNKIKDAEQWEDKTEEHLLSVPPFTIHNTISLSDEKLKKTLDVIKQAVAFAKKSKVPKITRILYGDIYIVGQITQSKSLAWYAINTDTIYMRTHFRFTVNEVHNLIHELGHRYYHKFLTPKQIEVLTIRFHAIKGNSPRVTLPKVGETVPIEKGQKIVNLTVQSISGGRYHFEDNKSVTLQALYKYLKSLEVSAQYPTPYSSVSAPEFFCESLAMYAMGTLPKDHKAFFKTLLSST